MRIGIVCALVEEAEAVFARQGETDMIGPIPVRRIIAPNHEVTVATCGLGKVNAALTATLLTANADVQMLLMSGTCGKIGSLAGDAFWIAEALQHDYGAEIPGRFVHYSAGSFPLGEASVEPFTAMADPGVGLPHARMASGDRFIGCPDRARFLADGLKADLVDMEVGALAQTAQRLGLPWAAIKAPTDEADENSGRSFHEQLAAASDRAAQGVERLVSLV